MTDTDRQTITDFEASSTSMLAYM